jgi:membrane-bound lytic murein transglycosylase D
MRSLTHILGWITLALPLTLLPAFVQAEALYPLASARNTGQVVQRIERMNLPLAVTSTDDYTCRKIREYMGAGGVGTERMLGRANVYFPIFEYYLAKHGMPESLKYLAVAESMLVPGVTSPAHAAGLWQLMPATAREMGLRVDGVVDERMDLHRSTEAAVLMLRDLYCEFGDWELALAAYNGGKGRLRRAIRRAGSSDFERVAPYLPGQTRRYVAAYVAAAYAVTYHDDHGLKPVELPGTSSLRVYGHLRLSRLARQTRVHLATLLRLNPMFKQGYVPDHPNGYRVRVPTTALPQVRIALWGQDNLVEVPAEQTRDELLALAGDQSVHPYRLFLGCSPESLVAAPAMGTYLSLERGHLLSVRERYRSIASL